MTLFDVVFSGNDTVYGLTEGAIDAAIEKHGADKAIAFPDTAYSLPCYYAVTGTKVATLGQLKEALGVVKTMMTREQKLNDAFMSGIATALCAEFIEVLKYIDGAAPRITATPGISPVTSGTPSSRITASARCP